MNRMAYYGVHGPKGLSKDVIDKVAAAVKKTSELPDVRKRIEDTGSVMVLNTPQEFAAQIKAEYEVYRKVVVEQNLKLD
jgi:tripartite-type tricarboxylate transporter receptor subunit TctC